MAEYEAFPLTSLLPVSSFLLAYSIPLLLLSVLLTFLGTFLTLDRTRSFPPRYDAIPGSYKRPRKLRFSLQGGVGGLAIGYAFGVHLSTFFALLVPSISKSKPLSPNAFVAVWLLSSILTTGLAGRWKHCALAFAGITGGTLFSLAICVAIHPARLTRLVLTSIITPILTILVLLPLPNFQHLFVRWATSAAGAGGMIITIALLSNDPSWSNVWERFWLKDGINWGTNKEKGLTAGWFLLFVLGIVVDFFARRTIGECPDEKWDSYLASYATNLPDRSGIFKPPTTIFGRLFGTKSPTTNIVFGDDHDSKAARPSSPTKLDPDSYEFQSSPVFLKKKRSKASFQARNLGGRKNRDAVKFKPLSDLEMMSSGSDSEDDLLKSPPHPRRPWLKQKASIASSAPTLVGDAEPKAPSGKADIDYDKEIKKLAQKKKGFGDGEVPEYSDYEDDISTKRDHSESTTANWSPGFIKKQQRSSTNGVSSVGSHTTDAPPGAVPATPSLIKALDRIAVAQKDAFSHSSSPSGLPSLPEGDDERWSSFWRDVNKKAKGGEEQGRGRDKS